MTQRLTQAKLQRALLAVSHLISAVHDARVRYLDCATMRPRRLSVLARVLKQMAALPHTADYSPYEADLKQKLIRARRRVLGYQRTPDCPVYALANELPTCYQGEVAAFREQTAYLLKVLADIEVAER